jgi:hypothetical protein
MISKTVSFLSHIFVRVTLVFWGMTSPVFLQGWGDFYFLDRIITDFLCGRL